MVGGVPAVPVTGTDETQQYRRRPPEVIIFFYIKKEQSSLFLNIATITKFQ